MTTEYSDVSHYAGLAHWGPVSVATLDRVIEVIDPAPGQQVLDVGCGRGRLLLDLAERYATRGVGIDRSEAALALARADERERPVEVRVDWRCEAVGEDSFEADRFDLVCWIGGPYLGDNFHRTLVSLRRWLRPGGQLLIGHGFWSAPPPPPYLEATGIAATEFGSHWDNIAAGTDLGLVQLYCCVSRRDEWDHFEGTILTNVERYAAAHPEAPDPSGRLEQRRQWHRAQQRWGRGAMGFGLYLFQRPPSD